MGLISGCHPESSRGLTTFPGVLLHTQPILPASSPFSLPLPTPELGGLGGKQRQRILKYSKGLARDSGGLAIQSHLDLPESSSWEISKSIYAFCAITTKIAFFSSIQLSSRPSLTPPLPPDLTSLKAILSLPACEGLIQALQHNHCLIKSGCVSCSRMVSRGLNFTPAQN